SKRDWSSDVCSSDLASQCAIDPFQVSLETKLGLLFRIDSEMRAVRGVKNAESFLSFQRKHQYFLSTEGSDIEQTLTRSGGGFSRSEERRVGKAGTSQ